MRGIELIGARRRPGPTAPARKTRPPGCGTRAWLTGLAARGVAVRDHGDLPRVPFRPDPDHPRQQNLGLVTEVARNLAGRVAEICGGGDESRPPRSSWAGTARSRSACWPASGHPDAGLMYFDGDIDVSTPQTTTSGILDTMGLAHMLAGHPGTGPDRRGCRAGSSRSARRGCPRRPGLAHRAEGRPVPGHRHGRPAARAAEAMSALARPVPAGAGPLRRGRDQLDRVPAGRLPALQPGLGYLDALACLRVFCRHEAFGGLVITEVNPHRDPDGRLTARLAADVAD